MEKVNAFQFQYGAIISIELQGHRRQDQRFNSSMVQLLAFREIIAQAVVYAFQFQYGAIIS